MTTPRPKLKPEPILLTLTNTPEDSLIHNFLTRVIDSYPTSNYQKTLKGIIVEKSATRNVLILEFTDADTARQFATQNSAKFKDGKAEFPLSALPAFNLKIRSLASFDALQYEYKAIINKKYVSAAPAFVRAATPKMREPQAAGLLSLAEATEMLRVNYPAESSNIHGRLYASRITALILKLVDFFRGNKELVPVEFQEELNSLSEIDLKNWQRVAMLRSSGRNTSHGFVDTGNSKDFTAAGKEKCIAYLKEKKEVSADKVEKLAHAIIEADPEKPGPQPTTLLGWMLKHAATLETLRDPKKKRINIIRLPCWSRAEKSLQLIKNVKDLAVNHYQLIIKQQQFARVTLTDEYGQILFPSGIDNSAKVKDGQAIIREKGKDTAACWEETNQLVNNFYIDLLTRSRPSAQTALPIATAHAAARPKASAAQPTSAAPPVPRRRRSRAAAAPSTPAVPAPRAPAASIPAAAPSFFRDRSASPSRASTRALAPKPESLKCPGLTAEKVAEIAEFFTKDRYKDYEVTQNYAGKNLHVEIKEKNKTQAGIILDYKPAVNEHASGEIESDTFDVPSVNAILDSLHHAYIKKENPETVDLNISDLTDAEAKQFYDSLEFLLNTKHFAGWEPDITDKPGRQEKLRKADVFEAELYEATRYRKS